MKKKYISQKFFNRDTVVVAKSLLGKYLVRKIGKKEIRVMITEVEVYDGFFDKASHASRGKTNRNKIMFDSAGRWYVYFTYGMHWMLNIVTKEKEYPAAVLIRAVRAKDGKEVNGPARITKFLKIEKSFNGKIAIPKNKLWIENGGVCVRDKDIKSYARVGVSYAGPYWSKRKLRFNLK